MSKIYVYPKWYNTMYPNSKVKIVEKVYDENVRVELDNYLAQIKQLESKLKTKQRKIEYQQQIIENLKTEIHDKKPYSAM